MMATKTKTKTDATKAKATATKKPRARRAQRGTKAAAPPDGSTVTVSRETLDATPGRLLSLLNGIGTRPAIRGILGGVGYSDAEHQRGWGLLHAATGFSVTSSGNEVNRKALDAAATLDNNDERVDTLINASLKHRAPAARAYLLEGIKPGTNADSILYFTALLPRLAAVHARKVDAKKVPAGQLATAAEILEQRGLGPERCAELKVLLVDAQAVESTPAPSTAGLDREALDAKLRAARAFYEEWSELARQEIKRRDHLILMGLATRRSKTPRAEPAGAGADADAGEGDEDTTPDAPAPR
jgi:hypothetical protein